MADDQVLVDIAVIRDPTPDERRNGWTAESLKAYFEERRRQQIVYADRRPIRRVSIEPTDGFDPLAW